MAETDGGNPQSSVSEPTIIEAKRSPLHHTITALTLWIGSIHFNVLLVFTAFFFLPSTLTFSVFGLLLFLMLVPVNDKSKLGRKLARYICKHVVGYFPLTLYVEDMKAFDPDQAYDLSEEESRISKGSRQ